MDGELRAPSNAQAVILVAEDDQLVRNLVQAILAHEGYTVLSARDGVDALEMSRDYSGNIQLLLSDVRMPRMDGLQLSEHIVRERPDIRVLLMSGKLSGESLVDSQAANFLRKPFLAETLRAKVKMLL